MTQILGGRSNPLKKTENDVLQLNVTNSVLTDNKERHSEFKGTDCTSENNNLLKNACFDSITDNRKLRSWKNALYTKTVSGTKNICGEHVKDCQQIGKSTLGQKDHKLVGSESIDLDTIYMLVLLKLVLFLRTRHPHQIFVLIHLFYKTLQKVLIYLKG